jgi:predicted transcriptional regulator
MEPRDEGIDPDLVARAEALAAQRGETVEAVIERALRAFLDTSADDR